MLNFLKKKKSSKEDKLVTDEPLVFTTWLRQNILFYALGMAISVGCILGLAVAYIKIAKKSYTSSWSMTIPSSSFSSKFALNEIGQASTASKSPYSSKSLSPKVTYKTLLRSKAFLRKAAKKAGVPFKDFASPRVKLITQTTMIMVKNTAASPQKAFENGWTLYNCFQEELERLRKAENNSRTLAIRRNIEENKKRFETSKNNLLSFKKKTGLTSEAQFKRMVNDLENLRKERSSAKAQLANIQNEITLLSKTLGMSPDHAALLLKLNADLTFKAYTRDYARAKARLAVMSQQFGDNHPDIIDKKEEIHAIYQAIKSYIKGGATPRPLVQKILTLDNSNMEDILKRLVLKSSQKSGQQSRIIEIENQIARLSDKQKELSSQAAELSELKRKYTLTKAVYSSALTNIDASKTDPYGSYPFIQMLAEPTFPSKPSSPKKVYIFIGAILASLVTILAWIASGLFQWFHLSHQKKKLSITPSI